MQKRSSKKNNSRDVNVVATNIVTKATNESSIVKNPAAVALDRLGGKKGGKARAEKLTAAQRGEIARKAAQARWHRREQ